MAEATIVSVDTNYAMKASNGKVFKVIKMDYLNDKGEEKSNNIFPNMPVASKVKALKKGDFVNLKFVKNGQYWNLDDVEPLNSTAPAAKAGAGSAKDEDIRRAVALKAAVDMLRGTSANAEQICALAVQFIPFLEGKELDITLPEVGEADPF